MLPLRCLCWVCLLSLSFARSTRFRASSNLPFLARRTMFWIHLRLYGSKRGDGAREGVCIRGGNGRHLSFLFFFAKARISLCLFLLFVHLIASPVFLSFISSAVSHLARRSAARARAGTALFGHDSFLLEKKTKKVKTSFGKTKLFRCVSEFFFPRPASPPPLFRRR